MAIHPVRIGTSGFSYPEWKPAFYPRNLPRNRFLEFYASRFGAVEIDSTFYRMPTARTLEGWRAATPDSFRFALKASRRITHFDRLRMPSEAFELLIEALDGFRDRLGVVLFQLPPNFKLDLERLKRFLNSLPPWARSVLEFRHESWFDEAVFGLLQAHGVSLCIHDADDHTTPIERTAEHIYVRLRKSVYTERERLEWQDRMHGWAESGAEVFAFIKHEDNPDAPQIAAKFAEGLG